MFLTPTWIVPDITEMDLDALHAKGIRGFVFDLDNTLMAPHTGRLEPRIAHWLAHLAERGFRSVVVTNNKRAPYIQEAARVLGLPVLGPAGKPDTRMLRQAVTDMGLEPRQVAVVGDRPLTDIWGGQRLGASTVLVDPLTKATEHALIQFLRFLERLSVRVAG